MIGNKHCYALERMSFLLTIKINVKQNIIKKVKEHGTIENLPKIGRLRMNSERTVSSLIWDAKINPKKTAAELLEDLKSGLLTSVSTVKRVLLKYNLFCHIAAKNHC